MPPYVDIHRLPLSADDVAKAHQADPRLQDECDRYQRYWASRRFAGRLPD